MSGTDLTLSEITVTAAAPVPPTVSTSSASPAPPLPDDVTITIDNNTIGGWESIRITRSLERVPNSFQILLSDYQGGQTLAAPVREGTPVQLAIGPDLVLTGYIDVFMPSVSPNKHAIELMGRSLSEDLVDCSNRGAIDAVNGGTFLSMAQKLASPFGISVSASSARGAAVIAAFYPQVTETPYEIMERIARFQQVLIYDQPDGSLILADLGTASMASGIDENNLQAGSATFSMAERFQNYIPSLSGTDSNHDIAATTGVDGNQPFPAVNDPGVPTTGFGGKPRLRQLVVVSGQGQADPVTGNFVQSAVAEAQWEAARRRGRGQMLRCVIDSWRDHAGTLWTPNTQIPINLPSLYLTPTAPWIIGQVTYQRDAEQGTTAELICMPAEAFSIEPIPLNAWDSQIAADRASGAAAPSPTLSDAATGVPTVRLASPANGLGPSSP